MVNIVGFKSCSNQFLKKICFLIRTFSRTKTAAQKKRLLGVILQDVQRLDRLITDISNASRLDSELSREEMGKVEIGRMVKALVDVHHTVTENYAPTMALVADEDSPEGLAAMIAEVQSHEGAYQDWRQAARDRSRMFHWDEVLPVACDQLEAWAIGE